MADTVHLINKKTIHAPAEAVYNALIDHKNFSQWWPKKMKVHPSELGEDGAFHIMFNPAPTVYIAWKLTETEAHEKVTYEYVKGPFSGQGIWKMRPSEGDAYTDLSYSIYLTPEAFLFRMASKTPLFRKKHLAEVDELMSALESYLNE